MDRFLSEDEEKYLLILIKEANDFKDFFEKFNLDEKDLSFYSSDVKSFGKQLKLFKSFTKQLNTVEKVIKENNELVTYLNNCIHNIERIKHDIDNHNFNNVAHYQAPSNDKRNLNNIEDTAISQKLKRATIDNHYNKSPYHNNFSLKKSIKNFINKRKEIRKRKREEKRDVKIKFKAILTELRTIQKDLKNPPLDKSRDQILIKLEEHRQALTDIMNRSNDSTLFLNGASALNGIKKLTEKASKLNKTPKEENKDSAPGKKITTSSNDNTHIMYTLSPGILEEYIRIPDNDIKMQISLYFDNNRNQIDLPNDYTYSQENLVKPIIQIKEENKDSAPVTTSSNDNTHIMYTLPPDILEDYMQIPDNDIVKQPKMQIPIYFDNNGNQIDIPNDYAYSQENLVKPIIQIPDLIIINDNSAEIQCSFQSVTIPFSNFPGDYDYKTQTNDKNTSPHQPLDSESHNVSGKKKKSLFFQANIHLNNYAHKDISNHITKSVKQKINNIKETKNMVDTTNTTDTLTPRVPLSKLKK